MIFFNYYSVTTVIAILRSPFDTFFEDSWHIRREPDSISDEENRIIKCTSSDIATWFTNV
jgi:hypothetical protein